MQREHSKEPPPKKRVAFNAMTHAEVNVITRNRITQHTPKQNRLLAALSLGAYARLLPILEPVSLPQGSTVYGPGMQEEYLYFLTKGVAAMIREAENGGAIETAIKGNEGVIGIASFIGGESMLNRKIVLSKSYAYRVPTDLLINNFKHVELLQLLRRYIQSLIMQVGRAAACNRHHSVERRLCSLILTCLDRSRSNELTITEEQLSTLLGVRRENLALAIATLNLIGLINYSSSCMTVIDRLGVERWACECYTVAKREFYRLHPL